MNTKLERLSQMLKKHWRTWVEIFKNEETGVEEPIERQELIEMDLTDEERQLIKEITDDIESLSDEDLAHFQLEVSFYDVKIIDKAYLERVRRGDEEYAEFIHDVPTLMALCEKGNRWAAYALYQKYRWGDEAQGIFINRIRAKHYHDFSGDIPIRTSGKTPKTQERRIPAPTSMCSGNILHMERTAPDRLVITTESDNGEPLLCALRQCFENLNVEM